MMVCPDDFRTPKYILRWIEDYYGLAITHDGACNELMLSRSGVYDGDENAVAAPIDIITEELPYNATVFINPPWDSPTIEKLVLKAAKKTRVDTFIVFLLPNKLANKAWVNLILPHFTEIMFIGGRINFEGPNAAPAAKSRHGCFLGIIDGRHKHCYPDVMATVDGISLKRIRAGYDV